MLHKTLSSFGLNDKEIKVYLTALELGKTMASVIAKRTGIPKSTIHYLCQGLMQKGFLNIIPKDKSFIISPEPPSKLLQIVEAEENTLKKKKNATTQIIEELKGISNPHCILPKVTFHEGYDGIINALKSLLENLEAGEKEILSYAKAIENFQDVKKTKKPEDDFVLERIRKGISTRVIMYESEAGILLKKDDSLCLRTSLLVPDFNFSFDAGEIFITKNRICTITLEKNAIMAYSVDSYSIAQMHKSIFELSWKQALEEDKKICKKAFVRKLLAT